MKSIRVYDGVGVPVDSWEPGKANSHKSEILKVTHSLRFGSQEHYRFDLKTSRGRCVIKITLTG